jgi:hypothetical protein
MARRKPSFDQQASVMLPVNMSLTATKATLMRVGNSKQKQMRMCWLQLCSVHLHVRREQRPSLVLTARHKHEHVVSASVQLSKMGIECNCAHWRFMASHISVGREVGSVADTANIKFIFGYANSRNV